MKKMRAFDFALRQDWAIQSEVAADGSVHSPALDRILEIAARQHEPDFQAVAQKLADRADEGGLLEMRGSVAVVNLVGPIFRYANLFTWLSGAVSLAEYATAFRAALDDPKVQAIVLNVDSPGGQAAGIGELATAIYQARSVKPIVAYADDLTASAAYWLASAAGKIVTSETAELGSIGVVASITKREPRAGEKTYEFVSSQSPNKRADLETDQGRLSVQQRIDDLAAVFVGSVARNRGVSTDKVLTDFGRGGVMIASKAIAAGMADEMGTFEALIEELNASGRIGGSAAKFTRGGAPMLDPKQAAENPAASEKTHTEADVQAAKVAGTADGRKAERERIAAILNCDEAKGREGMARTMALEMDVDPDSAKKLLAAAPKAVEAPKNPLAAAMGMIPNPDVQPGAGESVTEADEAKSIVAAYRAAQGVK